MDKDSFGAGDSSGSRRGTEYDVDDEERVYTQIDDKFPVVDLHLTRPRQVIIGTIQIILQMQPPLTRFAVAKRRYLEIESHPQWHHRRHPYDEGNLSRE